MKFRLLCLGILLAVAGCASAPGPNCARLAFNGWFCLLPPAALPAQSGADLVTVTHGDQTRHYVGQLSVTSERLELALTSLAGMPLATLRWDGKGATIRAPKKTPLDPKQLAALLELTIAAPDHLRGALYGVSLSVMHDDGGEERLLRDGGHLVARAVTRGGITRITVPDADLTLTLRSLTGSNE